MHASAQEFNSLNVSLSFFKNGSHPIQGLWPQCQSFMCFVCCLCAPAVVICCINVTRSLLAVPQSLWSYSELLKAFAAFLASVTQPLFLESPAVLIINRKPSSVAMPPAYNAQNWTWQCWCPIHKHYLCAFSKGVSSRSFYITPYLPLPENLKHFFIIGVAYPVIEL